MSYCLHDRTKFLCIFTTACSWVWTGRGLGAVFGLLSGGWIQELFGGRVLYRLAAGFVFVGTVVYLAAAAQHRRYRRVLLKSKSVEVEPVEVLHK